MAMKKASPWLLLIAGLTVGYPAARLAVAPAKTPPQPAASPSKAETPPPCPGPRCEALRVLGEFFGLEPDAVDPLTLSGEAKDRGYGDLRFLVALVPMPPDPRLDHALDAMQRGFAQSGWLVDRVWLPWTGKGSKGEAAAPDAPGLILFRRQWTDGTRSLALVFVVGETSKAGIRKGAFREALSLIAELQPPEAPEAPEAPEDGALVKILGPSFSGSAESLRVALTSWKAENQDAQGQPLLRFQAASGSATAAGLDQTFQEMEVKFCRTVVPDSVLHQLALTFLEEKMGWDLSRVALLTESDTAYGSSLIQAESGGAQAEKSLIVVPFPSHISELRNATQAEKEKAEKEAAAASTSLPTSRRLLLGPDLTDSGPPPDLMPTFSQDTLSSNELMLQNLLETLAREGVRAVGIIATDPKDKLFLAEKVREIAPDTVLFTFDNDLLFAHPKEAKTLDGMLIFTSAPLFTEGASWLAGSLRGENGRQRRQFTSELQQGDYEAVRYLLGDSNVSQPRAWIVAVGNGSLWPVARLDLPARDPAKAGLCGNPVDSDQAEQEGNGFAGKDDLQVLLVALLLVALGYLLRQAALLTPVANSSVDPAPGSRRLLVLGSILLALAAGMLLVVGSVPLWARYLSVGQLPVRWEAAQILYLLGLAAVYALLVANAARAAHDRITRLRGLAWGLLGAVALMFLAALLWWFCMPGGQVEYFHLRARAFSSGLSPLVSLAAVGGAVYAWILWELKRRRLIARQSTDCPVENLGDPAVAGVDPILKAVRALLIRTFPEDWRFWFLPAVAFLPPVFLLWATVQPVGEARGYGRLFILFVTLALSLGALSFFRFFLLWRWTSRILRRLDNTSAGVAEAFKAVAKDLEWRPIQSFSWQIPPFKTPAVSVRRLRELAAAGKVVIPGGPGSLEELLREVFANERDNGSLKEIEARNKLEEVFRQACVDLRSHAGEPEVLQFLALRVAAWLRYVFAHMRCCLIGALICGLLALVGVTAYEFQPKSFVSLAIWLSLAAAVGLTLLVFLQMDRNATLSRIGDTTPGKVSFDSAFWTKIFTYVGIPALGLVATQFPEVGALLGRLADQVLRVTGGG
jgi:hypothetical protein